MGAIVRKDWISGNSASGTTIVIPSAAHANGNALIFIGVYDAGALTVSSIVGGGAGETGNGSAWASLAAQIAPSDRYLAYGIANISAFTGTVTLTLSGSAQFRGGILIEVSGAALTSPFVAALATQSAPGGATDALTISASPTVQPGLAIAFFGNETQHGQIADAGTGWASEGTYMPFNGTSGTNGASNDAVNDTARLESKTYSSTGSQAATATTVNGISDLYANFVVFIKDASGASTATATPGVGAVTMQGRTPSTSAFQNVRIREVLVNASGQAVGSLANVGLRVWYAGIPIGAPDVSLNSMTTDANGTASWSIATGSLAYQQLVFYVAYSSDTSASIWTCARLMPSYE